MDTLAPTPEIPPRSEVRDSPPFLKAIAAGMVLFAAAVAVYHLRWTVHGFALFKQDDSAFYLYVGQQMARGVRLYRDLWDQKPPLLYWVNEAGVLLTPGSPVGVFALFAIATAAFWSLLLRAYWRISPSIWALLAALVAFRGFWELPSTPNFTEVLALPVQAGSLYLLISDLQNRAPKYINYLQGLAIVWLFNTRPNHIGIGLIWLAYLLVDNRRPWRERWSRLAQTAAAAVVGLACIYVPLYRSGILMDALRAFILGGARYSSHESRFVALGDGLRLLGQSPLGWLTGASAIYLAFLAFKKKLRHPELACLAGAWLLVELPFACISGYSWSHYYIPWLASFGLMIVVAAAEFDIQMQPALARIRDPKFFHRLATAATVAGCTLLLALGAFEADKLASFPAEPDDALVLAKRVSGKNDRIATWGLMPAGFWFDFGHPSIPIFCTCLIQTSDIYHWSANWILDQISELRPDLIIERRSVLPLFDPSDPQEFMGGVHPAIYYRGWETPQLTVRKQELKIRYEEAGREGLYTAWHLKKAMEARD